MLMAENSWGRDDFSSVYDGDDGFDGGDDLCIDMDTLFTILDEKREQPPGDLQNSPTEDVSLMDSAQDESPQEDVLLDSVQDESPQDACNHDDMQFQSGSQVDLIAPSTSQPPYCFEASDSRRGSSGDHSSSLEAEVHMYSPVQTCSASLTDWFPPALVPYREGRVGVYPGETPGCSTASSFTEGDGQRALDDNNSTDLDLIDCKSGTLLGTSRISMDSEFIAPSHGSVMENVDVKQGDHSNLNGNRLGFSGPLEPNQYKLVDRPLVDADVSSHNVTSTNSTICQSSEVSDYDDHYPAMHYLMNSEDSFFNDSSPFNFDDFDFQYTLPSNEEMTTNTRDEGGHFPAESACSNSRTVSNSQGANVPVSEVSLIDYFDVKRQNLKHEDSTTVSHIYRNPPSKISLSGDKMSVQPSNHSQLYLADNEHALFLKDERKDEVTASKSATGSSVEFIDDSMTRHSSNGYAPEQDMIIGSKRPRYCEDTIDRVSSGPDSRHLNMKMNFSEPYLHYANAKRAFNMQQLGPVKDEKEVEFIGHRSSSSSSHIPNGMPGSIPSKNSSTCRSYFDDDLDICILEDLCQPAPANRSLHCEKPVYISRPALSNQSFLPGNTVLSTQGSSSGNSISYSGVSQSPMRHKAHDEQLIYRVAMQDLSQPKSEASPPDGLLAVPLLRHQRIALSWMVQKETSGLHCSGGILADDQGLGKTVSTIALILKERPSSCMKDNASNCELETFNLDDEDDDGVDEFGGIKQESESCQIRSAKRLNSVEQTKGRPAAGTLIVCPTSVLRQWAEELRNKVTTKGNLSVLVYHGSNRTKDYHALAKYDVVVTTYSIVSMEVPKQPLIDKEEDDEKVKTEGDETPSIIGTSGLKRKCPPGPKQKKGADGKLLEVVSGPLAKVGWFRVVLDEAQSIKNYRTQVARACWGLRAKRRWCLSGTPIQNAIDDLYSYFRFLRYDPYAVYKSFCSKIKLPITRNPAKGYKKLQAVLKTIMLRRTKGTLLDGEPIINLPPKVIELKKVDFTDEEREFYNQLEIDSRDQFQEYAAAGTVEQNYVNILLMLLRLRQACDHPLLVKGFNSNSLWKSSIQTARKLPQERKMCLLKLLQASLAICSICNDSPEDAVVTICGHVFCDQCISERLTGDDHQCPATNCKVRLSASSVFSKATLDESLSDQPGQDISSQTCASEFGFCSSKIKAALEVLKALAKPVEHPLNYRGSLLDTSGDSKCSKDSNDLNFRDKHNDGTNSVACLQDSVKVAGEKAIVFSQWTKMLDLLEASLKDSSIQYRRLDGTMSVVARDKAVKDFNSLPEVSVMIMSLKAASLGLNMVAACRVLLLDLWWNPTTEDQAIDRAHRIGQTRPVTVFRLTVKDTVEDRILALQQKKREMVASAFGEDENGGRRTRLTMDDLKYLFMA